MAREATITQEQVSAAANAIRASGTKPTARSVREQLGTGSMGTVHQFMQVWLADQKGPSRPLLDSSAGFARRHRRSHSKQEIASAQAALESSLADAQQAGTDLAIENERQTVEIDAQALTGYRKDSCVNE